MDNNNLLEQHILECLVEGGLEDLLQDMTESPYPFSKDYLKQTLHKWGLYPLFTTDYLLIDFDQYDTIEPEPDSPTWLNAVKQNFKPDQTIRLAKIFKSLK